MSIDIFLSSNSRSGYSQDIVDLLAKPNGDTHQFRYASKWISPSVLDRISINAYSGSDKALVCFVDQGTKNITPIILPIRFAEISEIREHGSTKSIIFKLAEFCKFEDLTATNEAIRRGLPELPSYDVGGELSGKYWLYEDDALTSGIERSNELRDWEALVRFYYQMPNAVEDLPFYRFEGFADPETKSIVTPSEKGGQSTYELEGGKAYQASVYHFHPNKDFPDVALKLSSDSEILTPLNGDSRVLHTRYDQKDYRFITKRLLLGARTSASFQRTKTETGELLWEDFRLTVNIKPSYLLVATYVLAVACAFAAPFVVRSFSDPNNQWPVVLAAIIGGLIVSVATLFRDKSQL